MRRILLLSLAVLPLVSNSVFAAETTSEPDGNVQQSSDPMVKFDSLKESGVAQIMRFNASLTSTKEGFHVAIPILPIMFRGDNAQSEMNVFEFFSALQNNPKLLFREDGSPESQSVQMAKVVTNPEAIQQIITFMKQDIKVIVEVLNKIMEMKIIPADVLLNTIINIGIRLNFNGTCEVVVPKPTSEVFGLMSKMCDAMKEYKREVKANQGKIWNHFEGIQETDKDKIEADIYKCADLLKSKQALETQAKEQKLDEQKLEMLQKKQAETEAAQQEQDAKKTELIAEIAKMEEQTKQIEAIKAEFESAFKALPSTAPSTTPNLKSAVNPFIAATQKLPEAMKTPYETLKTDIDALPANNTAATRRLRSEIWDRVKSAATTTQQEMQKTQEEFGPKIAQMKETLEKQVPVVSLTQEEQDEMERFQEKIKSQQEQIAQLQEEMEAMKSKYGERYSDIKIAARIVLKQPAVKSIDVRIQELEPEKVLQNIIDEAITEVENMQKRAYGAQEAASTTNAP